MGVKLSDLNAVMQQNLTRAGITLAGVGLTATAAGTIGKLVPNFCNVAPGAYPLLVDFAALSLLGAGFFAAIPLRPNSKLQTLLLECLCSEAGHPDAPSPELQRLAGNHIRKNFESLGVAIFLLVWGVVALVVHAYVLANIAFLHPNSADTSCIRPSLKQVDLTAGAGQYYFIAVSLIITFLSFTLLKTWKNRLRSKPVLIPPEHERVG